MGVFGAVFGCRGDAGFSGALLGACSGVVGFNVAMVSRQPVLCRSWMRCGALQGGCDGGFAPCEALWRRVAGVSGAWMASFTPCGGEAALLGVNRPISHVIPLRVVQILNSYRWNCNVFGWSRKMTEGNYVRHLFGAGPCHRPSISHAIPLSIFQILKSNR